MLWRPVCGVVWLWAMATAVVGYCIIPVRYQGTRYTIWYQARYYSEYLVPGTGTRYLPYRIALAWRGDGVAWRGVAKMKKILLPPIPPNTTNKNK
jgi:hypothetical protein